MKSANQINSFFVGGLFGRFDYQISLRRDSENKPGISIITAPNGYGKSTILRLIDDLVRGAYQRLSRTKFKELVIQSENGGGVLIERELKDSETRGTTETLVFTPLDGVNQRRSGTPWRLNVTPASSTDVDEDAGGVRHSLMTIERAVERELGLRRISVREWLDPSDGRKYSREDLILLFEGSRSGRLGTKRREPEWLTSFRESISVLHISANRLRVDIESSSPRRSRGGEMVEVISERVLDQIRSVNKTYAEMGRRLEQDFAARVIDELSSTMPVTEHQVSRLIDDVRGREIKYQALGLLSEGQTAQVNRYPKDPSALKVLGIYLKDIERKLDALQGPADRLDLFVNTINSMLLFKRLKLIPETGFQVVGDDNLPIPLKALSSGEQHLIVLLGELIFESAEGGTVLLDEPEISFHPEWQERFPKVLDSIVRINKCAVVMATHSPTLIQDKWDAVIELAEQVHK